MTEIDRAPFVVVSGMPNLGKTCVTEGIVSALSDLGITVEGMKYPVYKSKTGEQINDFLRKGNPEGLSMEQAQKLYAQNRKDYEPILLSKLDQGIMVVAEDHTITSKVWGPLSGVPRDKIIEFNEGLIKPDLTLLLDGDRLGGKENGHIFEEKDHLWERGRILHKTELFFDENARRIEVSEGELQQEIEECVGAIERLLLKGNGAGFGARGVVH